MSKRRRNKNNNSEQGCEVILVDSGARPEVGETDTSWVDVPDDRSEEEKEKDFRINIVKDSEDDYVDAPDETKPDFGVSYDDKMTQILEEVSECESDCESDESSEQVLEDSNVDAISTSADSSAFVVSKLKKVKEAFEPKSDKEPATLGGTIIIILLIVVALIMVVNLCSVMGRLPVHVEEKETNVEQNMVTNSESAVEVIDTSKVQEAVSDSDKTEDKKREDLSKVPGTDSSVILDEAGNPIVDESDSNVADETEANSSVEGDTGANIDETEITNSDASDASPVE